MSTAAAMRYAGADWMEKSTPFIQRKGKKAPLGRELNAFERTVADILGATFLGIYHVEDAVLGGEWAGRWVRISLDRSVSTFDFDELTALVVLCHDAAVRLDIGAVNFHHIELLFHPRTREGGISERHPTIEEAIERTRTHRVDLRAANERMPAAAAPGACPSCGPAGRVSTEVYCRECHTVVGGNDPDAVGSIHAPAEL